MVWNSKTRFRGSKKISIKVLDEKSKLVKGTLLSPFKIFEATQNILAAYKEKHYHNVKLDTVITRSEARDFADLTIIITENSEQVTPDIIIVVNIGVSVLHLKLAAKIENPIEQSNPNTQPRKVPACQSLYAIKNIPNNEMTHAIIVADLTCSRKKI